MKKVFIIHGFEGSPNGGWRPWLLAELDKLEIYACALAMPSPEKPSLDEWVDEIKRHVDAAAADEVYLVGHSLGVPAILHYLAETSREIKGAVLVSGPSEKTSNKATEPFYSIPFDFEACKKVCKSFVVIHGDDDPLVSLSNAYKFEKALDAKLVVIPGGGHLNGGAGWHALPECLEALSGMIS